MSKKEKIKNTYPIQTDDKTTFDPDNTEIYNKTNSGKGKKCDKDSCDIKG